VVALIGQLGFMALRPRDLAGDRSHARTQPRGCSSAAIATRPGGSAEDGSSVA
jgi:hypothetical protein